MSKYTEWLRLMYYIELEYSEGNITEATYNILSKALLSLHITESIE